MHAFLLLLFLCSGATALAYEMAWTRMLAHLLGGSAAAVTAVTSAYMLGLSIGAAIFGRKVDATLRPVRLYGKLELALAAYAAAFPWLVRAAESFYAGLLGRLLDHTLELTLVRFGLAFALLLVPTILMGGTLPVLVRAWVESRAEVGRGSGFLYAANTLGAVAGCAVAVFALFPALGIQATGWVAAGVSATIGLVALAAGGGVLRLAVEPASAATTPEPEGAAPAAPRALLYLAVFVAGASALACEVLWTRMMTCVVAGITYAFAAILAVYLLALALGAAAAACVADRMRARTALLGALQIAAGLAALASLHAFRGVTTPPGTLTEAFGDASWWAYVRGLLRDAALVVGPGAFLSGALLPVACRVAADRAPRIGAGVGTLYAWNTLGAVLGPVLATFVFIPATGSLQHALLVPVAASLAAGILLVSVGSPNRLVGTLAAAAVAMAGFAGLALTTQLRRPFPVAYGPLRDIYDTGGSVLDYEAGPTCTVTVSKDHDGAKALRCDAFLVSGTGPGYEYMPMLGHLPALLAASQRRALVVGFGTGTTAGALKLHPFENIDIVEIAPEVARMARSFSRENLWVLERGEGPPLVRLTIEDGSNFLKAPGAAYDVITAEPPLPYLSGASALYSRDFYQACRARLADGGLVVQWIPIHGLRLRDFQILARTFLDVFPEATMWYFRSAAILLGGTRPLAVDYRELERRLTSPDVTRHRADPVLAALRRVGVASPPSLLAGYVCGPKALAEFARAAPVMTDDRPYLEFYGPGPQVATSHRENLTAMLGLRESVQPRLGGFAKPELETYVRERVERASRATDHFMRGNVEFMEARLDEAELEYRLGLRYLSDDLALRGMLRECAAMRKKFGLPAAVVPDPKESARPGGADKTPTPDEVRRLLASATAGEREDGLRWATELEVPGVEARVRELLGDPDTAVRVRAIAAVGQLGLKDAIPRLVEIFDERTEDTSLFALASLVALGYEGSAENIKVLLRDRTPEMRKRALICLWTVRRRVEWSTLVAFLDDPDLEVRRTAIKIYGDLKDARWVPTLARPLKDPDWQVRAETAKALGAMGVREAAGPLFEALGDEDRFVCKLASESLRKLTDIPYPFDPDAPAETRAEAARRWRERWEQK